jgi:hypothetical protein
LKQSNEANFKSLQAKSSEMKQLLKRIEELESSPAGIDMSLLDAEVERQVSKYKAKYE